jgi:beta-mannanase
VQIARNNGARNVKWMWNPDRAFKGSQPLKPLWPGRTWVDWVGIDGYNYGTADHGGWKWFRELFRPTVLKIRSFAPYKPMMVAEAGCTDSKYKAAWMRGMFSVAPRMGFRAVMYFDYKMLRDWRITSRYSSLAAARYGLTLSTWETANPQTMSLSRIEYIVTHA